MRRASSSRRLALACVCSPAMAGAGTIAEMLAVGGDPATRPRLRLVLLGVVALAGGVCLAAGAGCRSSAS